MGFFKKGIISVYRVLPKWFCEPVVRLVSAKHTVGVVGVIFNQAGKVLVLHHTYDEPVRLPGGHMEYGETPFDTIQREMCEEANCSIEPIGIIGVHRLNRRKFDIFVIGKLIQESPFVANEEVIAKEWWDPAEANKIATLPVCHQEYIDKGYEWFANQKYP